MAVAANTPPLYQGEAGRGVRPASSPLLRGGWEGSLCREGYLCSRNSRKDAKAQRNASVGPLFAAWRLSVSL